MMTERAFTDREGLSGRPWYKHLVSSFGGFWENTVITSCYCQTHGNEITQIYAPSLHNDYGAQVYPGVDDAIQWAKKINTSESWQSVQHEIYRVSRVINQAALVLSGGLTWVFFFTIAPFSGSTWPLAVGYNFLKTVAGLIQYCGGCDMKKNVNFTANT
jgi:hypothetical protein